MTLEEKRSWIGGIVAVVAYAVYVIVVLGRAGPGPLADTPYVGPLLVTVGAAIVAAIVANIAAAALTPAEDSVTDVRDREIGRLGEQVGNGFVGIGAVAALALAVLEVPHFWIANAVFLAFVLSAVLGAAARLGAYRQGL